jgi:hypothetical protein
VRFASLLCRQLGLGDDKNRWVPKLLNGYTIIHPDRTLRRNRKPVLKALLLQEEQQWAACWSCTTWPLPTTSASRCVDHPAGGAGAC